MATSTNEEYITLSMDDIEHDLKNARPDDILFDEDFFEEVTGRKIHDTSSKPEIKQCYQNLCQYLEKEKELDNLVKELKNKSETLRKIKEEITVSKNILEIEAKSIQKSR